MIFLTAFILLVAIIGFSTHKLNAKTPCTHDWRNSDNSFTCCKCQKQIPDYTVQEEAPVIQIYEAA